MFATIQRLYTRIEALPQVTLAEIGGAALDGGFELALSCDLRIAAADAKIGLPEVKLGLIPGAGGTQRLTRLIGRGRASRLILLAETVDGTMAEQLGLVQWCCPRAELASRAAEIAQRIAAQPRTALAAAKQCITAAAECGRDGFGDELEATYRLQTDVETRERISAFLAGARPDSLQTGSETWNFQEGPHCSRGGDDLTAPPFDQLGNLDFALDRQAHE